MFTSNSNSYKKSFQGFLFSNRFKYVLLVTTVLLGLFANTCFGDYCLEFDGIDDALLAPHDEEGNLFVEYTKDWGIYTDVPLKKIDEIFSKNYKFNIKINI